MKNVATVLCFIRKLDLEVMLVAYEWTIVVAPRMGAKLDVDPVCCKVNLIRSIWFLRKRSVSIYLRMWENRTNSSISFVGGGGSCVVRFLAASNYRTTTCDPCLNDNRPPDEQSTTNAEKLTCSPLTWYVNWWNWQDELVMRNSEAWFVR